MNDSRIVATYWIETPGELAVAAQSMAGEQSTGTFARVPGETDELRRRFAARVDEVLELPSVTTPSLDTPAATGHDVFRRGQVKISFPLESVGANLPTLISTVAGNLFELRLLSGLRLLDIEFPSALSDTFAGPQFGVEGTRRLSGVWDRPIIGTIIKPSVGLSASDTAQMVRTLGEAGLDFIKDDELMANPPHSPLDLRVDAVMRAVNELADKTGKKLMFAFNISDQLDSMLRHHDKVLESGGTCVMVSLNSVGFAAVEHLRRHSQLPIHGHRNGWGMFSRCRELGMDFVAYQKLWRLCGVDHLHVNGLQNKFCESDESVVRSINACMAPMLGGYEVMPVISSGQWGGQAPQTYQMTQTIDVMYLAGAGILAHPSGPAAGVKAMQQAWKAAVDGTDLSVMAQQHSELRQSLEFFGKVEHVRQ